MGTLQMSENKVVVGGMIKHLSLDDWWANDLDEKERKVILETHSPLGSNHSIVEGEIFSTSETKIHFLWGLAGWFDKPELRKIAFKIINKAESLIDEKSDPIDVHFLYGTKLELSRVGKEASTNELNQIIEACRQQIHIAPAAAKAFIKEYGNHLPSHKGYRQLATILEEKHCYDEAIELNQQAKSQGWAGDWDARIERCRKNGNIIKCYKQKENS